jgi:hypothetical protein
LTVPWRIQGQLCETGELVRQRVGRGTLVSSFFGDVHISAILIELAMHVRLVILLLYLFIDFQKWFK